MREEERQVSEKEREGVTAIMEREKNQRKERNIRLREGTQRNERDEGGVSQSVSHSIVHRILNYTHTVSTNVYCTRCCTSFAQYCILQVMCTILYMIHILYTPASIVHLN